LLIFINGLSARFLTIRLLIDLNVAPKADAERMQAASATATL